MANGVTEEAKAETAKAGKYLTFALGKEEFGVEIIKVREIIGLMKITGIPQAPSCVEGVINLRGKVIPVVNLRLKFGMPEIDFTSETCIIVLSLNEILIGIIIDKVMDVLELKQDQIEPVPNFSSDVDVKFISGMGKVGDKIKILLDIDYALQMELLNYHS